MPVVKVIDRYVLKHLLISYGLCLVSILGIFMLVDVLSNLERLLDKGSFLTVLASYLSAAIPLGYYQIAPGTFLMAAMFTLSGLNKSNELLALRASGVSIYRVLSPVIIASLLAAAAMALVQEVIIPAQADTIRRMGKGKPVSSVRSKEKASEPGGNLRTLKKGWAIGAPELLRSVAERMGVTRFVNTYGLSEQTANTGTTLADAPLAHKLRWNGRPYAGTEMKIRGTSARYIL